MTWRPLNNVVFVEPDEIEKISDIIIAPEKNTEEKISNKGTVVSVGPEVSCVKPGDRIIFDRFFDKPSYTDATKKVRIILDHYIWGLIYD